MRQTEKLREQILSQKPTDEQRGAIFTEELEFLLRASPGSGKTWTSCRRFIWRGANWVYKVGGLALLSFTNAAIREFYDATIKVGRRELLSDPNYVGTFDSFVERFIITPFGHLVTGSSKRPRLHIAPRPGDWSNNKLLAWSELSGGRKLKVPAWEIIPFPDNGKVYFRATKKFGGKILKFIGYNPVEEFFKLGLYTHGQRVYLACRLLFKRPHIANCISRRFPEIIVDEAQDTNIWLLILLNFLREKGTKVTLVGDPDQCIYEFSMADATSLPALKEKWQIPEKPLSKSFRCNNLIAASVQNVSGNASFVGCGASGNEYHRPFVVREPSIKHFGHCIEEFERLLGRAGLTQSSSAILCRAHEQLESIRGDVNYTDLKGITKEMAQAAFQRDARKDYKKAFQIVENAVREMIDEPDFWENLDNDPESESMHRIRLELWRFVKSSRGLPSISDNGIEWIEKLKANLTELLTALGIKNLPKIGQKIRRTGLNEDQLILPLFAPQKLFPPIRQETIHQVKGESIDGVLLLGSVKFFNAVVAAIESNENTEERRLAYVAMTRARHALMIGLPASHFDKHVSSWTRWGFSIL
jgi:superfamily I DNA/RNA helicase